MAAEQTVTIAGLVTVLATYLGLTYLHTARDPSVEFKDIGYSISAVSDSPERQLLTLLLVTVFAYITAGLMYGTGRNLSDPAVSLLGLGLCMTLFGTILTRASANPRVHYFLAAMTMALLLAAMVAMALRIRASSIASLWYSRLAVLLTLSVTCAYLGAAVLRLAVPMAAEAASALIGVLEIFSMLMFVALITVYYRT